MLIMKETYFTENQTLVITVILNNGHSRVNTCKAESPAPIRFGMCQAVVCGQAHR